MTKSTEINAKLESVQSELDALASSSYKFKDIYKKWDEGEINDAEFHSMIHAYVREVPGSSLIKNAARNQAMGLEFSLNNSEKETKDRLNYLRTFK
jgi:hypothetical protein